MADVAMLQHPFADCPNPDLHCHEHDVDTEPMKGYRWCPECWHMFATPAELLAEHNKVLASLGLPPETDVEQVHTCPHCVHDF